MQYFQTVSLISHNHCIFCSWLPASLHGYFVKDTKGPEYEEQNVPPINLPGLTFWWQGVVASSVEFTNPRAVEWWTVSIFLQIFIA